LRETDRQLRTITAQELPLLVSNLVIERAEEIATCHDFKEFAAWMLRYEARKRVVVTVSRAVRG
jgi:hypothetical protein